MSRPLPSETERTYWNLAVDAISKCMGFDPYLPQSDAMIAAWAESLMDAGISEWADVEMAVRVMYRTYGDPGWKPTPKVLIDTAVECRTIRLQREAREAEKVAAIEGPPKFTYAEFRQRHPDVTFPKFGKKVSDA